MTFKEMLKVITENMAYKYVHLVATGIATLIDLARVSLFDNRADTPFLVVLVLLQAILLFNLFSAFVLCDFDLDEYLFSTKSSFPELLFFLCNFLCSPLNNNFLIFLIANFLKIINAMRVSDILSWLQKRWRDKMIIKYE